MSGQGKQKPKHLALRRTSGSMRRFRAWDPRTDLSKRITHRRPTIELLEGRCLLAVFTPLPTAIDGSPDSLRAAIIAANTNGEDDTIELASGTFLLTLENPDGQENESAFGDLDIIESGFILTIVGQGVDRTVISQNALDRVLQVAPSAQFILKDLTIRDGTASDDGSDAAVTNQTAGRGGGILVGGSLTAERVRWTENKTLGKELGAGGGGLFADDSSTIYLLHSSFENNETQSDGGGLRSRSPNSQMDEVDFRDNFASGVGGAASFSGQVDVKIAHSSFRSNASIGDGGALHIHGSAIELEQASIDDNRSEGNGGGIANQFGSVRITQSAIIHNRAKQSGGGLFQNNGTAKILQSTLSGNVANLNGGGVLNFESHLTLTNSTVAMNIASSGGGLFADEQCTVTMNNSIVIGHSQDIDSAVTVLGLHNVVGTPDYSGGISLIEASGNIVGKLLSTNRRATLPYAEVIAPLALHGGNTSAHPLISSSSNPAIGGGRISLAVDTSGNPFASDQRGAPFLRVASSFGKSGVDIGSFEFQTLPTSEFIVTTIDDELDAAPLADGPGDLSLREAVHLANGSNGHDTITFAPALSGSVLKLGLGEIPIRDDLSIIGLGARRIAIDGDGKSRLFSIDDRDASHKIHVEIAGLTLQGGSALGPGTLGNGGAISSLEMLTIRESSLTGNTASSLGGAIYSGPRSETVIENSTISGNSAIFGGAAALSNQSSIQQSTISSNHAEVDAGGIIQFTGSANITSTTITANVAGGAGGGAVAAQATMNLTNSIVIGNLAPIQKELHQLGGSFSGAFNLIGDPSSAGGFKHAVDSNIVGRSSSSGRMELPVSSVLTSLGYRGGSTPTHGLVKDSPAMDSGFSNQLADQRGGAYRRNQGGQVDIGPYERQSENDLVVIVNTSEDQFDPEPLGADNLEMSLREAIAIANQGNETFIIRFDPRIDSALKLNLGEIVLQNDLIIEGNQLEKTVIDAENLSRIFSIETLGLELALSNIELRGGTSDRGGAIHGNDANITLINSTLTKNHSLKEGGAIFLKSGSLTLRQSSITGNTSDETAGGVSGEDIAMTLLQSSISENRSSFGGGFQSDRNLHVIRFTESHAMDDGFSDGFLLQAGSVAIIGGDSNDEFQLNFEKAALSGDLSIRFDGDDGDNTIRFVSSRTPADVTNSLFETRNFNILLLASDDLTVLTIDAESISRLSPDTETIQVGSELEGNFRLTHPEEWRMGASRIVNGVFLRSLENRMQPVPRRIEVGLPLPWRNLIQAEDVNNDGRITASDALQIINELQQKTYSLSDGVLVNPFAIVVWPNRYFDVSGDGRVTAFDALQVINHLVLVDGEYSGQFPDGFPNGLQPNGEAVSQSIARISEQVPPLELKRRQSEVSSGESVHSRLSNEIKSNEIDSIIFWLQSQLGMGDESSEEEFLGIAPKQAPILAERRERSGSALKKHRELPEGSRPTANSQNENLFRESSLDEFFKLLDASTDRV